MKLILKTQILDKCTIGKLYHEGKLICYTLELPWKDNKPTISCIPGGSYTLTPNISPKFGQGYVLGSVGHNTVGHNSGIRTHILIHKGNTTDDTYGCLLVGMSTGTLEGKMAILQSRKAFTKLMDLLDGFEHQLEIIRA